MDKRGLRVSRRPCTGAVSRLPGRSEGAGEGGVGVGEGRVPAAWKVGVAPGRPSPPIRAVPGHPPSLPWSRGSQSPPRRAGRGRERKRDSLASAFFPFTVFWPCPLVLTQPPSGSLCCGPAPAGSRPSWEGPFASKTQGWGRGACGVPGWNF